MAEHREHPLNRHLFIADNLNLLRALDNESVDLICIDPPFAKNQTFTGSLRPPLSDAERQREAETLAGWGIRSQRDAQNVGIDWPDADNTGRFSDIWRWEDDVHEDWVTRIEDDYPALAKVIDTTRATHSEGTAAYLTFMAIRIIEMHRVLKPTGSMYLHCDDTAVHYLKGVMDALFGSENYRNNIIWKRATSHNDSTRFGRIVDHILFYAKEEDSFWNAEAATTPKDEDEIRKAYPSKDERGRYRSDNMTGPKHNARRGSPSTMPWRGYDVFAMNRVWSVPKTGKYAEYIERNFISDYRSIEGIHDRLDALDKAGLIHHPKRGRWPGIKRYASADTGNPYQNLFLEPLGFTNYSSDKERTGYPTQKPVALAERLIRATTKPGDVVLDCFAGCAYVPVASERNGRQWIACDISPRALTVLRRQFAKFNYAVDGAQQTETPLLNPEANIITRGPGELPERSDEDPVEPQSIKELPPRKFKVPASRIPEGEMMEFLLGLSGYTAWCCGYAVRRSSGEVVKTTRNFHLDHIDPKSKQGSNQIMNRAPLCPDHNIRKNNRRVHLEDYRAEIADAGEMLVDTTGELIDLAWAYEQALGYYAEKAAGVHYGGG